MFDSLEICLVPSCSELAILRTSDEQEIADHFLDSCPESFHLN